LPSQRPMSRSDAGMVNEVLCKFLRHNLTCLIQEQETLGIAPVFWKDEQLAHGATRAILPVIAQINRRDKWRRSVQVNAEYFSCIGRGIKAVGQRP
jgi:hypothetical protein